MKKWLAILIVTLFLFFPTNVLGKEGIENYYIDAYILDNGDLHVKELFVLNGNFNGFERIIDYRNSSISSYYNGDSIEILSVKDIEVDSSLNFNYINNEGTVFRKSINAEVGDYGVYTLSQDYNGVKVRIYNPSKSSSGQKGFYIEYIIKNMAIKHNDYAEIGWNIFSNKLTEKVYNLEARINIPKNKKNLFMWAHGPLWGNISGIDKNTVLVTIDDLDAYTPIDVRLLFDTDAISESKKLTNLNIYDSVIEEEQRLADDANRRREEEKKWIERNRKVRNITNAILVVWGIGLIFIIRKVYKEYDEEFKVTFDAKYFRDFPSNNNPEIVEYLFKKKVTATGLSSSILNLIYKGNIKVEKDKKDYILVKQEKKTELTKAEKSLLEWLFEKNERLSLKDLKRQAKTGYESFLKKYNEWVGEAEKEGNSKNFYIDTRVSAKYYLYALIPEIMLFLSMFVIGITSPLIILAIIISVLSITYMASISKRTIEGAEEFAKWKALKNFMVDFGRMDEKDLPEIVLWEKYLVYAVVLGCAQKLAKTMKLKINEFNAQNSVDGVFYDTIYMNNMLNLNRVLNEAVNSAFSAANSEKIAHSTKSSGSGFGGGFSSGGGSFGGGGGGGRF